MAEDNKPKIIRPAVALNPTARMSIDKGFAVIRPQSTPQGDRRGRWREHEYVQLAIQAVHGCSSSEDINKSELTKRVNVWLDQDAGYRALPSKPRRKVSRRTVRRVLTMLRP